MILSSRLSRRALLSYGAFGAASLLLPSKSWAADLNQRPPYQGPRIILIRFGGGVRRRETIDQEQTYAPYLRHVLAPQGTLFPKMELDQIKDVTTSHGEGTLYLLTGKYNSFINNDSLRDRFEPQVPTLFEYLRKNFDIDDHEVLTVNGEDRTAEEFLSFSNHHSFGINYRCQVLSLYRFKVYRLRQQVQSGTFSDEVLEQKKAELQELESLDYRNVGGYVYPPKMVQFWQDWYEYYGDSGLVNPRGDRVLTELTVRAIQQLQPKFMMVNYNDPDYVHWGFPAHYTNGITIIDQGIQRIMETVNAHPIYRDNTIICIVPDCGRDSNPFLTVPYQHHFNSRSAHEIFALLVGSGIQANQVVDRKVSQIDIAPTLAKLMGFDADYAEGEILEEAFA